MDTGNKNDPSFFPERIKMKTLKTFLVLLAVLISSLIALKPLGMGATVQGMQRAIQDQPGTFLYENEKLIVAAWNYGSRYAFAVIAKSGEVVQNLCQMKGGQSCDWKTIAEFAKWMEGNGFKNVLASDLPKDIVAVLGTYRTFLLSTVPQGMSPALIFVPVGLIEQNFIPTGVAQ